MNNIDSGALSAIEDRQSLFTHREEYNPWGQPPASHHVFDFEGDVVSVYLIPKMLTSSSPISANLTSGYDYFVTEAPGPLPSTELEAWETLSDEALAALYDEAAEEDQFLAQIGLAHYAKVLRQEEEAE